MPGFEIFGEEEKKEIMDVLDTGVLFRYEFGEQRKGIYKVKEFEEKFAHYCNSSFGQAVTSGSTALKVALTALGIGPGDEVITQGFTFVATWEAILEVGAIPVFCEVDSTLNMDPADLLKKITQKTKCIIPVHMLGAPARIKEIVAIADKNQIPVLEDTAQAAGARIDGKHLGSFGRCGTFSFDSVKTMTTGEGGMIITDDEELWKSMSEYHDHGHDHKVNPGARGGEGRRFIGFNYRMMELQGAIGLAQLAKLNGIVAAQQKNKAQLKEAVSAIPGVSFRTLIDEQGDSATFLTFTLQDRQHCSKVNDSLKADGCGAINFAENSWHFYPKWEHLLEAKSPVRTGYPFNEPGGKKRIVYDPKALPQSAALLERTLVYPIPIKMDSNRLAVMSQALQKASLI
ncbi:DegT/DnrJ/EryC1/StrS aminotransferase family protein [Desulforhopalus sp. IMCC35007]|uniref:DegT/DnrJ/EryC1/StrS family aminotransferase n=1 Tax=Desulforhopalus sp. IMCC35007 TaxID=2569543 RepID=UPI0010AE62E8|nr:DegT/DnrJ/EryC1/StrS family aminotransferase [Desulforhopalus sp. IMCC35007]TKB11099.1 DegT/DnrJ/EryC1/StrS family aminotransferase [Desulforhopalus sp. IMCC35007]